MFLFLVALFSDGVIGSTARDMIGSGKPAFAKATKAGSIPVVATNLRSRVHKQIEYLPPAEGLHPKSVIFPGSKGGAYPTHFLYHEPEGCVLPQKPADKTFDGPLTPAQKNATGLNGVFLLLHACAYNSDDWFALPEEVPMVRDLLSRGFLLAAPDAIIQPGGCWAVDLNMESLVYSFGLFRSAFGLEGLPLYAVGSSSGGTMLSGLVAHVTFAGTMFIASPGDANANAVGTFSKKDHPPTAFVLMPPDTFGVKSYIMGAVSALERNNVPVVSFEVEPKPISTLIDRADAMRIQKSVVEQMVSDISNVHFCRMGTMPFVLNPGFSDVAYSALIGRYVLTPVQQKSLWEELKVVEGVHSPTSEHFSEGISFLLQSRDSENAVQVMNSTTRKAVTSLLHPRNPVVPKINSTINCRFRSALLLQRVVVSAAYGF